MDLPDSNSDYRDKSYWDNRYSTEEVFDWFSEYSAFKHLLKEDIKPSDKILVLGCGNSLMSEQMYNDGYMNIINTDYSPVVIQNMKNKCKQTCPEMAWEVMDILHMTYEPKTFDVVLEKGTLDALMVHEKDPWNISTETEQCIEKVLHQILMGFLFFHYVPQAVPHLEYVNGFKVKTVLKPDGKFISITFAQPHFRKPHYARQIYDWSVEQKHFGKNFHYYYYIMQKGESLSLRDIEKEKELIERKLNAKNEENVEIKYFESDDNEDFLNGVDF